MWLAAPFATMAFHPISIGRNQEPAMRIIRKVASTFTGGSLHGVTLTPHDRARAPKRQRSNPSPAPGVKGLGRPMKGTRLAVAAASLFTGMLVAPSAAAASTSAPGPVYWHHIVAGHSSQCLDVAHVSLRDGAKVIQGNCNGRGATNNQHWRLEYINASTNSPARIVAGHSRMCLDVAGASRAHAANVIQSTCGGPAATSQLWSFKYIMSTKGPYDWYQIVNQNSGMCLDVAFGRLEHGAKVVQGNCGGPGAGSNQLWRRQRVAVTWG
jgi:hypothetical protein